ncbi:UDP-glucuronosyl/UDP-glucosyltransferase - like 3 [Theobroma cacao]|nr:UDP-glucuronosyl/UDP-glucosyltransferase - like 3 [Theobroma cacao]
MACFLAMSTKFVVVLSATQCCLLISITYFELSHSNTVCKAKMRNPNSSKLHLAMFPWFSFGHFIPYLHLSNKLAEKGHEVSFLLPKGAQPKLEQLNQYPNLIQFFPLVVSHVDGILPGAQTTSDVPLPLHSLFAIAFDQTRDQVEAILRAIKPDIVFHDLGYWIPALAHQIGIKSIHYPPVTAAAHALLSTKKVTREMTVEELMEVPPGYPSSKVKLRAEEVSDLTTALKIFGIGLSFRDRIITSMNDSDVIAFRAHREIEGPYCDYVAQHFGKPAMLTGTCLPETNATQLEDKWANWLSNFEPSSVVFCAFGSQITLQKEEFQELVLGLELSGQPFLVALTPPDGCTRIEEALPEGFQERIQGRGLLHGGWFPQELLLSHPSIGCFVNHCGPGTMWESLLSDCQIVFIPRLGDQILNTRLMVEELKVAVEAEKGENSKISKENLSKAIKLVMDKDNEISVLLKRNHAKLKKILSNRDLQEEYINNFIKGLQDLRGSTVKVAHGEVLFSSSPKS